MNCLSLQDFERENPSVSGIEHEKLSRSVVTIID